jgi:hypothetical protein
MIGGQHLCSTRRSTPGKARHDTEDLLPITGLVRINQALIANNGLAANMCAS